MDIAEYFSNTCMFTMIVQLIQYAKRPFWYEYIVHEVHSSFIYVYIKNKAQITISKWLWKKNCKQSPKAEDF